MSNSFEQAAVFIDGGYVNKVLRNYFNNIRVDYAKLNEYISTHLEVKRLRTYFYTCLPLAREKNEADKKRLLGMQKFLSNLKRLPRFEVKLGRLQVVGGNFKQKMVDILMSLDIVDMCFDKQIEHAVLIAGDSDFVPAIKKAKQHGAIIHLFYHPSSVHNELLDEIDESHTISKELVEKCKLEK